MGIEGSAHGDAGIDAYAVGSPPAQTSKATMRVTKATVLAPTAVARLAR